MNRLTKKGLSEIIDSRVKLLDEIQATFELIGNLLNEYCDDTRFSETVIIGEMIEDYDRLKSLIYLLEKRFNIKLKRTTTWDGYGSSGMITAFENYERHLNIWFRFNPDKPPKELVMGCHIKTEKIEEVKHTLVCDI